MDRRKRKRLLYYTVGILVTVYFVSYLHGISNLDSAYKDEEEILFKTRIKPPWQVSNLEDSSDEGEIEVDGFPDSGNAKQQALRVPQPDQALVLEFNKEEYITLSNRTVQMPTDCVPNFQKNADFTVLDMMRHCGPKNKSWIPEFAAWSYLKMSFCRGRFVGYDNEFAVLHDVIVDKQYAEGLAEGENVLDVLKRVNDEVEYYKVTKGFFMVPWCDTLPEPYHFRGDQNHLSKWVKAIKPFRGAMAASESRIYVTIAITRYEYYNIYHTVSDLYNTFLVLTYLRKKPRHTRVLLIERHPRGDIDSFWSIFQSVERLSSLPRVTHFKTMIWGMPGINSYFFKYNEQTLPLVEDFRDFVLNSFNIIGKNTFDCKLLTVTIISRKDYISNPRNPKGILTRKILNEKELVTSLRIRFPGFDVRLVSLEQHDIVSQLQQISNTDILVGMHGAGLTHAMFLPKHSGVVELLPDRSSWDRANENFKAIARWRGLKYVLWRNDDITLEVTKESTKVPPEKINSLVSGILGKMCPPTKF